MGHSKQEKIDNHNRVVNAAAAQLRAAGLDGPGVAELMEAAGLTHGGFYRHFASRDELVAEAVEHMKDQFEQRLPVVAGQGLARLIDDYLSVAHRDAPATGCAVVAIGGDIARSSDRSRSAYTQQVQLYLSLIGEMIDAQPGHRGIPAARAQAMVTLSTLVGAMLIARATNDDDLSRELLDTVRRSLTAPTGAPPPASDASA